MNQSILAWIRVARRVLCAMTLMMVIAWPTMAVPINNTPLLPITKITNTTFLETGTGSVSFTVKNNTGVPLILDYALAIIVPTNPDPDDLASFTGVTADTGIAVGGTDTFTYRLNDQHPDVTDPDPGLNHVFFWVEFADATGCGPNPTPRITVNALGTFVFPAPSCTPTHVLDPAVLAALTACFNNPAPTVPGCQPTAALYTNIRTFSPPAPKQFPATANAVLTDIPEPATLSLLGLAMLGLFAATRRGHR